MTGPDLVVSRFVRARMAERRVKVMDLAERAGMNRATMSRKLNDISPFSLDDLDATLRALGLTWAELAEALDAPRDLPSGVQREVDRLRPSE